MYGALTEPRRGVVKGLGSLPRRQVRTRPAGLAAEARALGRSRCPGPWWPGAGRATPFSGRPETPDLRILRAMLGAFLPGLRFQGCPRILEISPKTLCVGPLLPQTKRGQCIHTTPVPCVSFHGLRLCSRRAHFPIQSVSACVLHRSRGYLKCRKR